MAFLLLIVNGEGYWYKQGVTHQSCPDACPSDLPHWEVDLDGVWGAGIRLRQREEEEEATVWRLPFELGVWAVKGTATACSSWIGCLGRSKVDQHLRRDVGVLGPKNQNGMKMVL